jgi:hypothetical protein
MMWHQTDRRATEDGMLTVRWRPDDGSAAEAIGTRDALLLLEAPATDRGVWWLDVEDPTADELAVVAQPQVPRPSTSLPSWPGAPRCVSAADG